jgi:hypothetical protein
MGDVEMIAKQYPIALPADYDMNIIRRRVASRGPAYDNFPGLGFKAFLISERGRGGAVVNQYAPFYVWRDAEAIWDFVAGEGFRGIIDSFGRPNVLTWLTWGVAVRPGLQPGAIRSATRKDIPVPTKLDLAAFRQQEISEMTAALHRDPVIGARVVAVNIERWALVRFTLWSCDVDQLDRPPTTECYEVLHLSAPAFG